MLYRMCLATSVAALFCVLSNSVNATQTVRELFDNLPNNLSTSDGTSLNGMTNDFTSVGLSTAYWTNNPPNSFGVQSAGIGYKGSFSVNWPLGALQGNILPDSANGANGCLDSYPGNLNTLTNPATMQPYSQFDPGIYATHPLDVSAYVNFQAASTNWFSVRIVKAYPWETGNSSAGLGFSTGNGTNDHFVGIGVTRPVTTASDGVTDIGDTDYATYGTLGQAGLANEPDTGGPYLPIATGAAQMWNSGVNAGSTEAGLLVGRLVTTPSGASEIDVVSILQGVALPAGLPTDPSLITWDATSTFTETNVMTQLLIWMHGPAIEYDAIRVGTTYAEVVGLETIGSPAASPSSTVYAGTTVSLSDAYAEVDSANTPMSYQWLKGGVPIDPTVNPTATNSTLVLSNTVAGDTGDYSISPVNGFGTITSLVTHVTVNPPAAPVFTRKPVSKAFYVGSSAATFWAGADGSPPFTYQWYHGATPVGSPTITDSQTNLLVLPTLAPGDAGNYSVTVQNANGSTNSGAGSVLTVIVPPAGSFAAKVLADSPWGYWRLDDAVTPGNTALLDEWGNNDGNVVNESAPTYQVPAAPYGGFPNPHLGIQLTNNVTCQVNLPKLPVWSNSMTLVYWVNNGAVQMCTMNGYGNGYGLNNNGGELIFEWASLGAPSGNGGLDTGLNLQTLGYTSGWTFCAIVVSPTEADIYLGNNSSNLVTASLTGLTLPDSTTAGDTAGLYPPGLGRMEWPYTEDGGGSGYNTEPGTWSDVAIFYSSLTPQQITSLYVAGTGSWITGVPDGAGNLDLNWTQGCILQQASNVNGPYTDVGGTPVPPYSVPIGKSGNVFYRVRNN